eukprot:INCI10428.2.p1 GENE.INCI10428.2~~INCI10428.2.p1  ORF type:complete len:320 (+),score=62.70 INCI10428.2:84-1043(+)
MLAALGRSARSLPKRVISSRRGLHSVLFCPGNKARVLDKALGLQVDAVIADFEDAVADSEKANARVTTSQTLRQRREQSNSAHGGMRPSIAAVRINDPILDVGEADLAFLVEEYHSAGGSSSFCCDALVLPKCEDPAAITEVARRTDNKLPIWCMIETPRGVIEAARIAALPEVGGLILGPNDLTKCLQGRQTPTREPLFFAMSTCVTAARAFGKFAIDGVHNNIQDNDGLRETCVQARDFGFSGKSLIHPGQVEVCHSVWRPAGDDSYVQEMRDIVQAWEARDDGVGVLLVNGRLVEELHVKEVYLSPPHCCLLSLES